MWKWRFRFRAEPLRQPQVGLDVEAVPLGGGDHPPQQGPPPTALGASREQRVQPQSSVILERALAGVVVDRDVGVVHVAGEVVEVAGARRLRAAEGLASPGVKLHGAGLIVTPEQASALGLGRIVDLDRYIVPYRNGKDLAQRGRSAMVIDLHGLGIGEVRDRFPEVYQWVLERVKPEREQNNEAYR